jgi:hypothetical protein
LKINDMTPASQFAASILTPSPCDGSRTLQWRR